MKEKLRITIVDKNETIIQHDFNAYDFFDKPFVELAKEYKIEIKKNTTMVSKHIKKQIIRETKDNELQYILLLLLKQSHVFNSVHYQKMLNALSENNLGSFNEVFKWFHIYREHLPYSQKIIFKRMQVET